jgi:hypothetical protein
MILFVMGLLGGFKWSGKEEYWVKRKKIQVVRIVDYRFSVQLLQNDIDQTILIPFIHYCIFLLQLTPKYHYVMRQAR